MDDNPTGTSQFVGKADDLAAKLADIGTAEAMGMAHQARELAESFRAWETRKPADSLRIAAIQQLMELNRRVMDYLSTRQKRRPSTPT